MMPALLEDLQRLELELQQPEVRRSYERLNQLLHPAFTEVGRSGRRHTRAAIIAHLVAHHDESVIESTDFQVIPISEGCAILTYRSAYRLPDGSLFNHTLRSSIWIRSDIGWQVLYHQGTPCSTETC